MLDLIFSFLLRIIFSIINIIISPIVLLLSAIFPDFANFSNNIIDFYSTIVLHIPTFCRLLCIPRVALDLFFIFLSAKFTFWLAVSTYTFIIKWKRRII